MKHLELPAITWRGNTNIRYKRYTDSALGDVPIAWHNDASEGIDRSTSTEHRWQIPTH